MRRSIDKNKPSKRNPTLAACLSAVLPGLGQFYNREWRKGAGFLVGALFVAVIWISAFDTPQPLKQTCIGAVECGEATPWDNQDLFFAVGPFLIGCIIWSVMDAFRTARGPQ